MNTQERFCRNKLLTLSTALVSLSVFPVTSTTLSAAEDNASNTKWLLEEVTVTARKREEGLQSTPISVSAFSGNSLEYRGVTNVSDIAAFTPSLTFQNNPSFGGASNAAAIYIRGVGQKEFLPTTDPGVGLYVDGVYIARSIGGVLDLVDVERIEVLRGPQGTLFGRNTIGGAISITTKKPHEEMEGNVQATYGTDNRLNVKGTINLPLSETVFSKFSVASLNQDGYVKRTDGINLGDDNTITGRAAFRFVPNDNLEINLSVEGAKDRENGPAMELIGINLGNPVTPNTPPFAVIHNVGANAAAGATDGSPCATPPAPLNLAVPGCYDNRYLRTNSDLNQGTAPAFSDTDFWGASLNVDWMASDYLTIKSITAYRDLNAKFSRDGDHSPHRISQYSNEIQQNQFTQELQFLGDAFEDTFQWILGLYYFTEDGQDRNEIDFAISRFRSGGAYNNKSYAAFLQTTYNITSDLELTAGLRYTDETKKFTPDQIIHENYFAGSGIPSLDAPFLAAGQRPLPNIEKTTKFSDWTPMINLAYHINDELMTYLNYSEGFKSGGFLQRVFPPRIAGITAPAGATDLDLIPDFAPEFVKVYEAGFKFSAFDNRLRLNGAVFQTKYSDMQIQVFTSTAPITKNAGKAEITGFELEIKAVPAEGWFLEAGMSYLDAKYTEIDFAETFVNKDNALERVPEWMLSAGISKEITLGNFGTLTPRLDWAYQSKVYNDTFNTEAFATNGYHLLNGNITWTNADDNLDVIFGVNNLTDKKYLITGMQGDAMQSIEGVFNRGREWYVTARFNF